MKVRLKNVGVIDSCDVEFVPGINIIVGSSGSGKSTLLRSIHNIAVNEFSDSDISFGKESMNVSIACDDNVVEYSRFAKSKGDKFYYVVNGEKYSKVGRQSLSAANDILKLGDIDINGDNINFNFNMQFSTPFLIFGSQSTLYNVLTYRSQFDISKINDCYNSEVKLNNNEINTAVKVRDQLTVNLDDLKIREQKLKPVEDLYSKYVLYKHTASDISDLTDLLEKFNSVKSINNQLVNLNNSIANTKVATDKISDLSDIIKYNNSTDTVNRLNSFIDYTLTIDTGYRDAESLTSTLTDLLLLNNKLSMNMAENDTVCELSSILNMMSYMISRGDAIGVVRYVYDKVCLVGNVSDKVKALSLLDDTLINSIDDAILIYTSLKAVYNIEQKISSLRDDIFSIENELHLFKACPLCGSYLHQENIHESR